MMKRREFITLFGARTDCAQGFSANDFKEFIAYAKQTSTLQW